MSTAGARPEGSDSLAMALALAVGLHAALIGLVHFDFVTFRTDRDMPSLDVILVDWATEEVPEEADFLAQVSQVGGGESPDRGRPDESALSVEPEPLPEVPQEEFEASPAEPLPEDLVRLEHGEDALRPEPDPSEQIDQPALDPRELREQSLSMARVSPDRPGQTDDFRQQPRRKFISASTREHVYASYMSAWIAKIERIGNMNYPEAARRQNLQGSLVVSVDIFPDGSVDNIRVLRSSGHSVLDEAAVRIVRLSAPFAPLPEEITDEVDILTITRTWQFTSSGVLRRG